MTISKKQYQAYTAAMQTMAGTRQVVMLYDGVIRCLLLAREAMRHRRIQERYNNLTRASEIVFGLQSCLDFEQGGEVAKVLYNFYASVDARIFSLHRSGDTDACDQLVADVRRMRDVWVEIDGGSASASSGGDNTSAESAPIIAPVPEVPNMDTPPGVAISA